MSLRAAPAADCRAYELGGLLAPGGGVARTAAEAAGAVLTVEGGSLLLEGPGEAVEAARGALEALLRPVAAISIADEWRWLVAVGVYESVEAIGARLAGRGGRRLAAISAVTGAGLGLSRDGGSVLLFGPPGAVAAARAECARLIVPADTVDIGEIWGHLVASGVFPSRGALAAALVGPGGATVQAIERATGAGVRVSADRSRVHIMGARSAVASARLAFEMVLVPAETVDVAATWGALVDRGVYESLACLSALLREDGYKRAAALEAAVPGASLRVQGDGSRVFLMGPRESVAVARRVLDSLVVPADTVVVDDVWGHLIACGVYGSSAQIVEALRGHGGGLLRAIEGATGAVVSILERSAGGPRVHIMGAADAVAAARDELDKLVAPSESISVAARWTQYVGAGSAGGAGAGGGGGPALHASVADVLEVLEEAARARFGDYARRTGVRLTLAAGTVHVHAYASLEGAPQSAAAVGGAVADAIAYLDGVIDAEVRRGRVRWN